MMMSKKIYDTIVIGMGASGVAALTTLAHAGKSVLGLEAANYIGGRVKTVNFGNGVVELGAEWIHGERPSKVFDLATDHNVPVKMQELDAEMYRSDGVKGDTDLMNELLEFCIGIVDFPPKKPQPLGEYITKKLKEHLSNRPHILNDEDFMSGFLHLMNLMVNNYESTTDWNEVSTSSKYTPLDGHQHWSWHKYGYKTFFDILLNKHNNGKGLPEGADILLNREVVNILWTNEPEVDAIVKCKDGVEYRGRNVIVTVSLGVLKDIHKTLFTPNLPQTKQKSIEVLSMGLMGKIILSFDRQWWPSTVTVFAFLWRSEDRAEVPVEDEWVTQIYGFTRPFGSDNCLTFWTCGDSGRYIETLSDDIIQSKIMEVVRKFMGNCYDVSEPTGIVRSYWHTNPLVRGSYTFDSVELPQNPTARADLASPLCDGEGRARLLFAGEATNEYHFSTVHGAVETGLREAERILKQDQSKIKSVRGLCTFL